MVLRRRIIEDYKNERSVAFAREEGNYGHQNDCDRYGWDLADGQGQLDLPRLTTIFDELEQRRQIRFVVATGNEIGRMRNVGPELANHITFVVANGAFRREDKIVEQHWDSRLVGMF